MDEKNAERFQNTHRISFHCKDDQWDKNWLCYDCEGVQKDN